MAQDWRRRPGDRVVRHPRQQELEPVHIAASERPRPTRRVDSPFVLMYGFGGLIAIGTTLLWLPFFNTTGEFAPFLVALFTATSAVCVTGLVVVNTGTYWNEAGQAIIMLLILVGGLGFMSAATFLLVIVTQRLSLANQLIMREFLDVGQSRGRSRPMRGDGDSEQQERSAGQQRSIDERQFGGLLRLTVQIVTVAVVIQFLGFILFYWRLIPQFGVAKGAWQAVFLSISAFNNAGFDILPGSTSLALFSNEVWILGVGGALIIFGGISYTFIVDLWRRRRFNRFSLDSKLVLVVSLALWVIGSLFFFFFEFGNEATLASRSFGTKILDSVFQSISARTAGFSTIDFGAAEQHTNMFMTWLMFIGGAAGSTAGGIKINTFAVILATVWATTRGGARVVVFRREIPASQIQRALTVATLAVAFVAVVSFLMVLTETLPFDRLLFETISAFATSGLSTGITTELSQWGKSFLTISMFLGRIGPLTIALALGQRQQQAIFRYSQERVRIG